MKLNLIILSVIFLTAILATGLTGKIILTTNPMKEFTASDQKAPDFSYKTLTGEKSNLGDHQGKAILVHFWASWCPPCVIEFPTLLELAQSEKDNLVILAITLDENEEDVHSFLKKLKRPPPSNVLIIQDKDKNISHSLYGTVKLPETYVIKADLTLVEKITGPVENWNRAIWKKKINMLSGE